MRLRVRAVTINLDGILPALDLTIFDVETFKAAFGADSITTGAIPNSGGGSNGNANPVPLPPVAPPSGGNQNVTVSSRGEDNSGVATEENAANANIAFTFEQGNYDYTVNGYGIGDQLDFLGHGGDFGRKTHRVQTAKIVIVLCRWCIRFSGKNTLDRD